MDKKVYTGLIIILPKDLMHTGVVLESRRMKDSWYKVSILTYDGNYATCKIKRKPDGEHFWYRNYILYDTKGIITHLY